jgi:hypothetical protein
VCLLHNSGNFLYFFRLFTGVISSGNSPALGPVAEELAVLTILTDGCTDFLFDTPAPRISRCGRSWISKPDRIGASPKNQPEGPIKARRQLPA